MSDSDSKDSDEGIRYKTDSVRNKAKVTDISRKRSRNSHYQDEDRSRHEKRYSSSSAPRKDNYKKYKKRRNKSRSSRSSTSSSDDNNKRKLTNKDSKKEDSSNSKKITSHLKSEISLKPVLHDEIMGPLLPPHLLNKNNENSDSRIIQDYEEPPIKRNDDLTGCRSPSPFGPKLPSHIDATKSESCIGPSLSKSINTENIVNSSQLILKDTYIGPQLPPHLLHNDKNSKLERDRDATKQFEEKNAGRIIGPSLPPHLHIDLQEEIKNHCSESNMPSEEHSRSLPCSSTSGESQESLISKSIGPSLPPHLRQKLQEESCSLPIEEEEEDIYGPLPAGMSKYSLSHQALEERALQLKIDRLDPHGNNEPVRESWMIELPAAKASNFGLGPRQFRNRSGPDLSDRSSWTDLPGEKTKKKSGDVPVDLKVDAELKELRKRDEEQELLSKKHKRKEKSLLKMHKEKLEQEKKNELPSERRPFSRDIDLQVNKFDDAQKKAIMKKAQFLDDRFSSGKSKFL